MFKTFAVAAHQAVELGFARVRERRMPDIVRERQRFGQILVQTEHPGDRAGDLRHLDRVRQAVAEVIRDAGSKYLRLIFETPERARVYDPVSVPLKFVSIGMRKLGIPASPGTRYRKS